jgi:hypothetical protein
MIYLVGGNLNQFSGVNYEKIVNVNVIKQDGNSALIEINGIKTEAKLEAETPSSFLAFVEKTDDGIRLRVLSSFKGSKEFGEFAKNKLMETIKIFFMNNNIIFNRDNLEIATMLYQAGIKLDKSLIAIIGRALSQYGFEFASTLISLMKSGVALDNLFAEFLYNLLSVFRRLLKSRKSVIKDGGISETGNFADDKEKTLFENLIGFFGNIFKSPYEAKFMAYKEKEFLVQAREINNDDRIRYFFDISSKETGKIFVTADKRDYEYSITVFINKDLYKEINEDINKNLQGFRDKLNGISVERRITIRFKELEDEYAFYKTGEIPTISGNIGGLDIFA